MMSDEFFDKYNALNEQPAEDSAETLSNDRYSDHTEPVPQSEPVYTNPYMTPQSAASSPATNEPVTDAYHAAPAYTDTGFVRTDAPASYDEGFYHHSFTRNSDGSNINYTRPATPVAPPAPKRQRKEKRGMSKGAVALLLIVCMLLSGAAGFGGSMLYARLNTPEYEASASDTMVIHKVNTEVTTEASAQLADKTTAQITQDVADTVVEITTEVVQTSSFYGQYIAQGAGSGVIISADGYILTNNHVIEGASSVTVTTRGGDTYEATVVGADADVDIALLKVEASGLPVAVIGDSSTLEVGDKAVIIGNPLGTLGGSVTEGIISALDRSIAIDGKTMHLMQTDAAINPGNSGGGMFNGQGELAGIVVAKSSSEEIDNIGFVIPINNVLDILGDLKDYGYVRGRADTGMSFIDLSNQMYAWYYYNGTEAGCYISSVDRSSNAYEAGFREGDRVISVDGQTVSSSDDIEQIISEKSAGDTVTFELDRSGSTGTLDLVLEEQVPDSVKSSGSDNSTTFGYPFGNR